MSLEYKQWIDSYESVVCEDKYCYSLIIKGFVEHDFKISTYKISDIINKQEIK